jgi:peptide/nickel transport system ATP-binding protein
MSPVLVAENIAVHGPGVQPVRGVSLALEPGGCVTILGESGSGKSLLVQAILGLLPHGLAAEGRVEVRGRASAAGDGPARRPLWGRTVAVLPQEPWLALDPTMRIGRQVAEVHARLKGASRSAAAAAAEKDLAAAGLAGRGRDYPHVLSGGMAQRAALAISRAGEAPVLIVDEPTKGLDAPLRDNAVAELRKVAAAGGAVLTITHDVHVARALGGRILVMLEGEVIEEGEADAVLTRPRHPYTQALRAAAPEAWPTVATPAVAAPPILTATGLSKAYGGRTLFAGVDLAVAPGERIAITGPSGSGKSTLGNILVGLRQPDRGAVTRAPGLGPVAVQKLYQDPIAAFPPAVSVRQAFDDLVRRHRLDWSSAEAMMRRLRLSEALLDRLPGEVSSGELQRFAVVRLLLLKPSLIFADEPTSRLDPISQKETFDLLLEGAAATNAALIVVTHDPGIARAVAHRAIRLGAEQDR